MVGASFISPELKNEFGSIKCDYLIKYLMGLCFVTLSDTNANIGDASCYFSLYAASGFLTMRMKLREGAWGKDAPSFRGERRPLGASLTIEFSNRGGVFPQMSVTAEELLFIF